MRWCERCNRLVNRLVNRSYKGTSENMVDKVGGEEKLEFTDHIPQGVKQLKHCILHCNNIPKVSFSWCWREINRE